MKHDPKSFDTARGYSAANSAEINERVQRFVPLVRRAAWHIYGVGRDGLEIEDLVQAGMLALTECAAKHTGSTEDGFAAYAKMRVRGAMFDCLRKLMLDSRGRAKKRKAYDDAVTALSQQFRRMPSRAEIAAHLQCGEDELADYEAAATRLTSLDEAYDESNTAFADDTPDPFESLAEMENKERLVAAMTQLPERLQLVLQLFFVEEMNLTEIAQTLDVSVPRVHQLRGQALKKLKELMSENA
jgi:RNA polymerase sigma factor for flagellar operon FliA